MNIKSHSAKSPIKLCDYERVAKCFQLRLLLCNYQSAKSEFFYLGVGGFSTVNCMPFLVLCYPQKTFLSRESRSSFVVYLN